MKNLISLLFAAILTFNGFAEDTIIKEWRTISEFNSVSMTGNFELYLIQDSRYELTIEADRAIISNIVTTVTGKTLSIRPENYMRLNSSFPVKIYARMPEIRKIYLAGSGFVKAIGLKANKLEIELYGTGNIDLDDLIAEFLNISAYGSGKIDLDVNANNISANVTGNGSIYLGGACPLIQLNLNGTGEINSDLMQNDECTARIIGTGNIYTSSAKYLNATIYGTGNIYVSADPELSLNMIGTGKVIKQKKKEI